MTAGNAQHPPPLPQNLPHPLMGPQPNLPLPPQQKRPELVLAVQPTSQATMRGNTAIQKAIDGPSPGSSPAQHGAAHHGQEPGHGKSGSSAEEVRELASEVWTILKRRLAFEAMRMGRH
jgi:hypothetical protein